LFIIFNNFKRIINLARDYATKRKAFGKFLIDQNLHCQTLANMEVNDSSLKGK
jgi:hypothetical protein